MIDFRYFDVSNRVRRKGWAGAARRRSPPVLHVAPEKEEFGMS
ncbi:MAG: hypothetical protein WAK88_14460 [Candidatus Cybelea sp.]